MFSSLILRILTQIGMCISRTSTESKASKNISKYRSLTSVCRIHKISISNCAIRNVKETIGDLTDLIGCRMHLFSKRSICDTDTVPLTLFLTLKCLYANYCKNIYSTDRTALNEIHTSHYAPVYCAISSVRENRIALHLNFMQVIEWVGLNKNVLLEMSVLTRSGMWTARRRFRTQ
jgi:hypothetical protein